jgi:MoxR-like ATPase
LQDGLYHYDALGRLQEASLSGIAPHIGRFIRLGPLGTALLPAVHPRVLLIDEIDKSDIDLPNDLLHVFEEGEFEIPELSRLAATQENNTPMVEHVQPADGNVNVPVVDGRVRCAEFPIVVMTSNGEREFPPAFLRRCVRLTIKPPGPVELARIVDARLDLDEHQKQIANELISQFIIRRDGVDQQELSTDQLLNAVHMITQGVNPLERDELLDLLLRPLNSLEDQEQV